MSARLSIGSGGIELDRQQLAQAIVDRQLCLRHTTPSGHVERGISQRVADAANHLRVLEQSLHANQPALFRDYVAFVKILQRSRGIDENDFGDNLRAASDVLSTARPRGLAELACEYLTDAIARLPLLPATSHGLIDEKQPLGKLLRRYVDALLVLDRHLASRLIRSEVARGTPIRSIYLHVLERSQSEIGRLWQCNQINMAQEHFCTSTTQALMTELRDHAPARSPSGHRFIGACVEGEWHELGMRTVTDFFELGGWDATFLGASVPPGDLVRTLLGRQPDVVGLSVSIAANIGAAERTIAAIRTTSGCEAIKILVGGHPFQVARTFWKQLGADGTCRNAAGAVRLASRLIAGGRQSPR